LRDSGPNPGVQYVGDGTDSVAGLTGGSSFQDYNIESITAERIIVRYSSVPDSLYPELMYTVIFKRSESFYVIQFVFPMLLLTLLTFISFWMNPEVTDRLGFSVTLILSLITHNIVVATFMPVCEEKVLMDYLVISCLVFGSLSLLETGLVLYLFNLKCETWIDAFIPPPVRRLFRGSWRNMFVGAVYPGGKKKGRSRSIVKQPSQKDTTQYMLRRQMYHQIFYAIDRDFGGTLSLEELDEFGYFIAGSTWSKKDAADWLRKYDKNWDGVLDYEEFAIFCEENLLTQFRDDRDTLREMIKGFLIVIDKKIEARKLMWMLRANLLDQFCRWAIPPGFLFFVILLFGMTEEKLMEISLNSTAQGTVVLSGLYPILFIFATYGTYHLVTYLHAEHQKRVNKQAAMQYAKISSEVNTNESIQDRKSVAFPKSGPSTPSQRWPARQDDWPTRDVAAERSHQDTYYDNGGSDDLYANAAAAPPPRAPPRPPVRVQSQPKGPPTQRFQTAPTRGNSAGNAQPPPASDGARKYAQF